MTNKLKKPLTKKRVLETPKTYVQYLAESKGRNQRIFAKYGCLVYISPFDQLYGKDDYEIK